MTILNKLSVILEGTQSTGHFEDYRKNLWGQPVKTAPAMRKFSHDRYIDANKDWIPRRRLANEAKYASDEDQPKDDFWDAHSPPSRDDSPVAEKIENGGDFSLKEVAQGFHAQPPEYFSARGPQIFGYNNESGVESLDAIREIIRAEKAGISKKIKVYRTVPKNVADTKLKNRDWVSPSKTYAVNHGEHRFGEGEYKIISQEVAPDELWWDGNDIREWGYDK